MDLSPTKPFPAEITTVKLQIPTTDGSIVAHVVGQSAPQVYARNACPEPDERVVVADKDSKPLPYRQLTPDQWRAFRPEKFDRSLDDHPTDPATRDHYAGTLRNFPADRPAPKFVPISEVEEHVRGCDSDGVDALGILYRTVLHQDGSIKDVPRMKPGKSLPKVYSPAEVARIIDAPENAKHRLVLMFAYGCGLRLSEIAALKPEDIRWMKPRVSLPVIQQLLGHLNIKTTSHVGRSRETAHQDVGSVPCVRAQAHVRCSGNQQTRSGRLSRPSGIDTVLNRQRPRDRRHAQLRGQSQGSALRSRGVSAWKEKRSHRYRGPMPTSSRKKTTNPYPPGCALHYIPC